MNWMWAGVVAVGLRNVCAGRLLANAMGSRACCGAHLARNISLNVRQKLPKNSCSLLIRATKKKEEEEEETFSKKFAIDSRESAKPRTR